MARTGQLIMQPLNGRNRPLLNLIIKIKVVEIIRISFYHLHLCVSSTHCAINAFSL